MSQAPSSSLSTARRADVRTVAIQLPGNRGITVFAAGLTLLLLGAFFAAPYLPMVDLPQHASQIHIWLRLADSATVEAQRFAVNLRTPYLTAYVLARGLAAWVSALPALKWVVWLSVVLHLVAFAALVRELGHPRWLGLLGLPLAFGYGFYFGFVCFIAAVPLTLLTLVVAWSHRDEPTPRRALVLTALLCATLMTHGFALGLAMAMAGPLLLRGKGSVVLRLAPLAAPLILSQIWLASGSSARSIGATLWDPRVDELGELPGLLLASSGADHLASVLGVCLLGIVALAVGAPSRALERWAPLSVVIGGYCLFPRMLGGFGPLHPRFVAFLVPALLIAFEPRAVARKVRLDLAAVGFCSVWFSMLCLRLVAFTRETEPVRHFVEKMPPGLRVRPIVFERDAESFPGLPALIHLPAYYETVKGGTQAYSFAMYPTSVIRYRDSVVPGMRGGAEWHPEFFRADAELPLYDCFLVHSTTDRSEELFGDRLAELRLDFHEDGWWAYRVHSASPVASIR